MSLPYHHLAPANGTDMEDFLARKWGQRPRPAPAPPAAGPPPASAPAPTPAPASSSSSSEDSTTRTWFAHSTARRVNTDAVIAKSLRAQYPALHLVIAPAYSCNLLAFAAAGHAKLTPVDDGDGDGDDKGKSPLPTSLAWKLYVPAARRIDGGHGAVANQLLYGKFLLSWEGADFVVYLVDGRDGASAYPTVTNNYILATDEAKANALVLAAGGWSEELHDEVWVFDQGYWQKSRELYNSIKGAGWDSVILDPLMKAAIIEDHMSFFGSREAYRKLKVPWKRGIIYHGPPGNGKTISIKAMMHSLYGLKQPVPTLYVRTLSSYQGPEYSIQQIFAKARQYAPCYLVLEDLDTIVSDNIRSYFLNEVDGLKDNDGIFMIGSTNHLDRLDPGISKRPSRFDRKYFFPDPDFDGRVAYCRFWQAKLQDNDDIDFPDELCTAVADITEDFSFAYIQEAFVAALLAIARRSEGAVDVEGLTEEMGDGWVGVRGGGGDDLDKNVLWAEMKKQIEILREGMEEGVEVSKVENPLIC